MGRIKQTNFHKTTTSKMMKSLAILAASLAAVQAQQGLGRLLRGEYDEDHPIMNDDVDEAFCDENPEDRRCHRRLDDVEGIIDDEMTEEDCDENPGKCGRNLANRDLGAVKSLFEVLAPWKGGVIHKD